MSAEEDKERLAGVLEAAAARLAAAPEGLRRARSVGLNRRWPRAHFHPSPELFMQTGGATRFEGPEQRWVLSEGEVGLMPRGVPHAETPLRRGTSPGVVVACHQRDGFILVQAEGSEGRWSAQPGVLPVASVRGRDAFRYLDEAGLAWGEAEAGGALAVDLIRVFLRVLAEEVRRAGPGSPVHSPMVEVVRAVAKSHLADPRLSVEWLAQAAGCSPDHLARRFRAETGNTVVAWVTEERVTLAQRLLEEGKYQVAEVGWACGFAQPSYFIRVFRARTGVTPLAWRRARAGVRQAAGVTP